MYSFSVTDNYELLSLSPSSGLTTGGTIISVSGAAFLAGSWCKFGTNVVSATAVVSSTLMTCTTPAAGGPGQVTLEVSGNNADFTAEQKLFEYFGTVLAFHSRFCNLFSAFCSETLSVCIDC